MNKKKEVTNWAQNRKQKKNTNWHQILSQKSSKTLFL